MKYAEQQARTSLTGYILQPHPLGADRTKYMRSYLFICIMLSRHNILQPILCPSYQRSAGKTMYAHNLYL